jgi:hypothetical protein
MSKEVEDQLKNGNFSIIKQSEVPKGMPILPSVWAMKRKQQATTGEVYKWKACLNVDGSRQLDGCDFKETYAPVAGWSPVQLMLAIALDNDWAS